MFELSWDGFSRNEESNPFGFDVEYRALHYFGL